MHSQSDHPKVIIMKLTPRYDPADYDPQSIKAALAQLFNDTLTQLWLNSDNKDKIFIGNHTLECTGGVRYARYVRGNRYDGVHLYGASGNKAYTESVLRIIREAGYIENSPPKYFRRFYESDKETKPNAQTAYVCPTQDTNYLNDRDIRKKTTKPAPSYSQVVRNSSMFTSNITVPTYNRFNPPHF